MGKWVLMEGMKLKPHVCAACGNSASGQNDSRAAFCEGVDINWGDSLYICATCMRILGQLLDMTTPEDTIEMRREIETLSKERDELRSELDTVNERVDRMLEGVRAKKAVQKDRARTKTKPKEKANA